MVVDVYGIGTLDPGAVPGWSTTDTNILRESCFRVG